MKEVRIGVVGYCPPSRFDESKTFLNYINALVRVGGSEQTMLGTGQAKKMGKVVIEYDLPRTG